MVMILEKPGLYIAPTEAEAPHLHAAIERLSKEAGIQKPAIYFIDSNAQPTEFQKMFMEHNCFAGGGPNPSIMMGDKFRQTFSHYHPGDPVSAELESILAHEIGHLKHRDAAYGNIRWYSPHIGLVAGMAAVWLYHHVHQKAETARQEGMPEDQVQQDMHQTWDASYHPDHDQHTHSPYVKDMMLLAKTLAGGLLGLGVGLAVFKVWNHRIEFRADRTSAELMGSGKPLANALKMIREADKDLSPEFIQAYREEFEKNGPLTKLMYMLTHPDDMERIHRLETWAR